MTLRPGVRVEFLGWGEPDPHSRLAPGSLGTVQFVDDAGTVHVAWDNGDVLGLVQAPMYEGQRGFRPDAYRVVGR